MCDQFYSKFITIEYILGELISQLPEGPKKDELFKALDEIDWLIFYFIFFNKPQIILNYIKILPPYPTTILLYLFCIFFL